MSRFHMLKQFKKWFSFLVILIFLMARASFANSLKSEDITKVSIPLGAEISSIDPKELGLYDAYRVIRLVFEPILILREGYRLVPSIVSQVAWQNSGLELSLKVDLKKFSDGSDVKLADVANSIKRCVSGRKKYGLIALDDLSDLDRLEDSKSSPVQSKDENEIRIRLKRISPLLLEDLAHFSCALVKPKGNSTDLFKGAIGSGPYMLSPEGKKIVFTKNPYFKGSSGPVQVLIERSETFGNHIEDAKKYDLVFSTKNVLLDSFTKYEYGTVGGLQLIFNTEDKVLSSEKVRRALHLIVDLRPFVAELGWPESRLGKSLIPYGIEGFSARSAEPMNLRLGESILRKLGYSEKKPFNFKILVSKGINTEREVKIWREKAFPSKLVKTDAVDAPISTFYEDILKKRFQAIRVVKYPGSIDAYRVLAGMLTNSSMNLGGFKSNGCDALIEKAFTISDFYLRIQKYQEADKCIMAGTPLIPLSALPITYAYVRKPWLLDDTWKFSEFPYELNTWKIDEKKK